MSDADLIRIRTSVSQGLSPKDACALALAYDEAKSTIRALRHENGQLRVALEHLEELRERAMVTLVPDAPKTVEAPNPLEFDDGCQEEEA